MKKFNYIVAALALLSGAMFCSCVEDETDLPLHNQHQIDFTASSDTEWQDVTRAEEEPQVMILEMEGDEDLEQPLYLHITCEDREDPTAEELFGEETTRGNVTTTENFVDKFGTKGFGLFAYVYKPGEWSTAKSDYIHNLQVPYRENTGKWHIHEYETGDVTSTGYYFWPGKNYNVQFYAYAPHRKGYENHILGVPSNYYDNNNGDEPDGPYIDFLLSNNNVNQFDLCVARSGELPGNYNQTLHLNFKHALSAIDFIADATMPKGTISSIYFFNTMRQDRYFFEEERWAGEEQYTTTSQIGFNKNYSVTLDGGKEQYITGSSTNSTFFMIPHTLKDDAYMRVDYTDPNGTVHNLSVSLKGVKWEMGKRYIYRLSPKSSSTSYTFNFEYLSDDVYSTLADSHLTSSYKGAFRKWYVTSTRGTATFSDGQTVSDPVGWDVTFSTDNGKTWSTTVPEMFLKFTKSHTGGVRTAIGTNIRPTRGVYYKVGTTTVDPNADPFKGVTAVSGTVDLSKPSTGSKRNTANCYIINRPGKYKLPLVYGNAIKNDGDNTSSYNPGNSATNALATFVDHNDKAITSPFIANNANKEVPTDAVLVYSDEPDLVTNVKLSTATESILGNDVKFIEFEVPEDFITTGNAIIAVRDANGDIMWSWHIWVTNYTGATTNIKGYNDVTYSLMNQCLGFSPGKKVGWPERSVMVRFTQQESGKTKTFTFKQNKKAIETRTANQPYYQWGRKDPMLAFCCATTATGTSDSEKPCYYSESKYNYKAEANRTSGVTIGKAIQTPYIFYGRSTDNRDWCSNTKSLNRWDATIKSTFGSNVWETETKNIVVKTIYDPSPVGFCVPTKNAYANVINEDANAKLTTDSFGSGMYTILGLPFCTTGDRSRYTGAAWYAVGHKQCSYWTATPRTQTYDTCANWIKIDASESAPIAMSALAMSSGFVVKSMKEK